MFSDSLITRKSLLWSEIDSYCNHHIWRKSLWETSNNQWYWSWFEVNVRHRDSFSSWRFCRINTLSKSTSRLNHSIHSFIVIRYTIDILRQTAWSSISSSISVGTRSSYTPLLPMGNHSQHHWSLSPASTYSILSYWWESTFIPLFFH